MDVATVRAAREADQKLRVDIEAFLADQIMRGPGRARGGGSTERLGKPCPESLAEFYVAEKFGFRIMPRDLVPGAAIDDQPADTLLMYQNLLSIEAETRERLEFLQQRKMSKARGRR